MSHRCSNYYEGECWCGSGPPCAFCEVEEATTQVRHVREDGIPGRRHRYVAWSNACADCAEQFDPAEDEKKIYRERKERREAARP